MVKDNIVTPQKLLLFIKRRYREFMNILSKNEVTREDSKNIKIFEKIIKRLEEQNRIGNEDVDILNYTKLTYMIFKRLIEQRNQYGGKNRLKNSRRNKKPIRLFTRKHKT